MARAAGRTLYSSTIGALPILDCFLDRLRLRSILRDHLAREDRRSCVATTTGLLLLLKNLLVSREPLYGIGEWAARHVPELLGLCRAQSRTSSRYQTSRLGSPSYGSLTSVGPMPVGVGPVRSAGRSLSR
jgi:hypothetical protein